MARYALINTQDIKNFKGEVITPANTILNVIDWDPADYYVPPENCIIVQSDIVNLGDTYDGSNIIPQAHGE